MAVPDPSRLRLTSLAWGIGITTGLIAAAAFVASFVRDGVDAALSPDAGGGATLGIILLVGGFGFMFGLSLAAIARMIAPKSWIVVVIALAIFCTFGGRFNASPVFVLAHWVDGAVFSLGFAAASIAVAAMVQWLGRWARQIRA